MNRWMDVHHYAANGDMDRLRQLDLSELTKITHWNRSAMHIAVSEKQNQVVDYLIERCPTLIAFEDLSNENALYYAVTLRELYMVGKFAANAPHLIDKTSGNTVSPIAHAIRTRYLVGVAAMLVHKPEVAITFVNANKNTLLHLAVQSCDISMVEFVLSIIPPSLVIAQNDGGFTALHDAVFCGLNMVQLVYSANPAAVHCRDLEQRTPAHRAVEYDDEDDAAVLKYFLRVAPSVVEHVYGDGYTLLHHATNINVAETIVKLKPDIIDINDNYGNTLLHVASSHDMALFLLKCKPSFVDIKNNDGDTALHVAYRYSGFSVVKAILSFKPDLVDTNNDGTTVLHIAISIDDYNILAQVFCSRMSNLYCKDCNGHTPYHLALQKRNNCAIQLFKQHLTIDMMVETHTFTETHYLTDCLLIHLYPELIDIVFAFVGLEKQTKKRKIED